MPHDPVLISVALHVFISFSDMSSLPVRRAGGKTWKDPTLSIWPENDCRIFVGNLGNEVTDEMLTLAFKQYASFNMARVVREKRTAKSKGFGFVSFMDPNDMLCALKEMHGKHIGHRPCMLKRSKWEERNVDSDKNKALAAAIAAAGSQPVLSASARITQKFKRVPKKE